MAENQHILGERGKTLEDEFSARRTRDSLRGCASSRRRRPRAEPPDLRHQNTATWTRLLQLGVHAETFVALSIVPLTEVAWADGAIDVKEEQAILTRAAQSGVTPGPTSYDLLKSGWSAGPSRDSSPRGSIWSRASTSICPPSRSQALRVALVERALAAASASGGVLGVGKILSAEAEMIHQPESAFRTCVHEDQPLPPGSRTSSRWREPALTGRRADGTGGGWGPRWDRRRVTGGDGTVRRRLGRQPERAEQAPHGAGLGHRAPDLARAGTARSRSR